MKFKTLTSTITLFFALICGVSLAQNDIVPLDQPPVPIDNMLPPGADSGTPAAPLAELPPLVESAPLPGVPTMEQPAPMTVDPFVSPLDSGAASNLGELSPTGSLPIDTPTLPSDPTKNIDSLDPMMQPATPPTELQDFPGAPTGAFGDQEASQLGDNFELIDTNELPPLDPNADVFPSEEGDAFAGEQPFDPEQGAIPPEGEEWVVEKDQTLKATLNTWCDRAGWTLVWDTNKQQIMAAGGTIYGTFDDAINVVFTSLRQANSPFIAEKYLANNVLRIRTR